MKVLVTQLCLTLCDPMDCSPPGSSVHGILQTRVLEWGAIAFSQGLNPGLLHCRQILYHLSQQGRQDEGPDNTNTQIQQPLPRTRWALPSSFA